MFGFVSRSEVEAARGLLGRGGRRGFAVLLAAGEALLALDLARTGGFDVSLFALESLFWVVLCVAAHAFVTMVRGAYLVSRPVAVVFAVLFALVVGRYVARMVVLSVASGGGEYPFGDLMAAMFAPFAGAVLIQLVMYVRALFARGERDGDDQLAEAIRRDRAARRDGGGRR